MEILECEIMLIRIGRELSDDGIWNFGCLLYEPMKMKEKNSREVVIFSELILSRCVRSICSVGFAGGELCHCSSADCTIFYIDVLFFLVWKKKLSAQEVQELVRGERNVPLIIDFYATWCGPCILMAQELEMVGSNLMSCCGLVLISSHLWVFILINLSHLRSMFVEGNSLFH